MKKSLKLISVLLVFAIMTTFTAISGSALATPLVAGNTKETATNIPAFDTEYVSELSQAGETDWFKFTTLSEDAYYTIYMQNYNIRENPSGENWSLNLYLFDLYSKQILRIESTSNANIKLEKNTTYYIRVNTGANFKTSTGNFSVRITYKLDPSPNVKEEATPINVNTRYNYSLDGVSDIDWYKLTAPISGKYTLNFENHNIYENPSGENWVLNLYIYDIYSKTILHKQRAGTSEFTLEKGAVYYIKIKVGDSIKTSTGNYAFEIKCDGYTGTPDPTPTPNPNPNPDPTPTPTPDPDVPAAKRLTRINIDTLPAKTTYAIGENFNTTGMFVSAKYADGSSKRIYDYIVSGFDSSAEGVSVVTISYTEGGITKTATISCTIVTAIEGGETDDDGGFSIDSIFNFFTLLINLIYKAAEWLIDLFSNL